jgi:hypothetical protein
MSKNTSEKNQNILSSAIFSSKQLRNIRTEMGTLQGQVNSNEKQL